MKSSFLKPNKKRIKQRHRDVIKAALRSKSMSNNELSKASDALINFCLDPIKRRKAQDSEKNE